MIQMYHVDMRYAGGAYGLRDVSVHVERGEFVFLTGSSGAGKTSLLRLLFAAEAPAAGQVLVSGRNLSRLSAAQVPQLRREIGVIFQDFKLLMDRTVYNNLHLVTRVLGIPETISRRKIGRLLKEVGLLQKADQIPYSLSGGEQQRVALARALMNEPDVVFADEPTGNLDSTTGQQVLDYLFAMVRDRGHTLVLVTHNETVARQCQRTLVLHDGRLAS